MSELTLAELATHTAVELPARELLARRRGGLINVGDVTTVVNLDNVLNDLDVDVILNDILN